MTTTNDACFAILRVSGGWGGTEVFHSVDAVFADSVDADEYCAQRNADPRSKDDLASYETTGVPFYPRGSKNIDPYAPSIKAPDLLQRLAANAGGRIDSIGALPGGSGFATMTMPLPAGHWSTKNPEAFNVPPMGLRCGTAEDLAVLSSRRRARLLMAVRLSRYELNERVRAAAMYAVRASTMNGKESDFDPDALVQNMIVGLLGYHTPTGLSQDEWANPKTEGDEL